MENPASWGEAERIVDGILKKKAREKASNQFVIGLSTARQITDALRTAGLLQEEKHNADDHLEGHAGDPGSRDFPTALSVPGASLWEAAPRNADRLGGG